MKVQAFDPLKDFTPVGGVGSFDHVIATNSNSSIKTFGDLMQAARAQPGKLNGGTGRRQHAAPDVGVCEDFGGDRLPERYLPHPRPI